MREIGDFDGSLLLIEIGCRAAERQSEVQTAFKLLQAHLLNTKGVVLWLLFDYSQSKLALEQALAIRSQLLDEDDVELIGTKANLASLTAAEGRYKEAQILYRQAEEDNDRSKEATHAKRLASCRYAATHGRLHTELGQLEEAERHLERSRTILASGEDNALYRRAIEYCFGNLRLAENKLLEAKQCYKVCLETFAQAITDKDQVRTCGCYYKLAVIEMLEGQPQAARYEESLDASRCVLMLMMLNRMNLREASNIALQINSMGWQGRITLLDANILRKFPEFERTQRETAEQLERRADAIKAALQAISGEEETAEKGFHLYIPWQTR